MFLDPIVAEIRRIREEQAVRFGFNIRAIVRDAQQRDAADPRGTIRLPPRPATTPARRPAASS